MNLRPYALIDFTPISDFFAFILCDWLVAKLSRIMPTSGSKHKTRPSQSSTLTELHMDVPWFVVAQFLSGIAATLLFRWLVPNLQVRPKKVLSLMVQNGILGPHSRRTGNVPIFDFLNGVLQPKCWEQFGNNNRRVRP